ncbi:hypothetical protein FQZ97_1102850 [compost metagenome]
MLHRAHHVEVEEAIEEAHVQGRHRFAWQQAHRATVRQLQVLDDDARLGDAALAVEQQRKLAQRPQPQPVCRVLRRFRPQAAKFEGRSVLVQRDEDFLRVRGEGMTVEHERHGGTACFLRTCTGAGASFGSSTMPQPEPVDQTKASPRTF